MARKLAITISGAVSLGSYEAGVTYELLSAVAQHNLWADSNNPAQRIEVDVLTGASAGGMTVAMLARNLLYDGPALGGAYDNPLYKAWVKDVNLAGLLKRGTGESPHHSILSSNFIIDISKRYLTAPPPTPWVAHSALPKDGTVYLGLALSNLNGVDYRRHTLSGDEFIYTRHKDQLIRAAEQSSLAPFWDEIREAAVACGAFPVAFRVQDLVRNLSDFLNPFLDEYLWDGAPSRKFAYTDGGVFDNEPLGMAKTLVEQTPDGRLTAEQRGYVYIAPRPKKSAEVPFTTSATDSPDERFGSANANYIGLAQRLAMSVAGQAGFQDWVMAEKTNDKIQILDDRAKQLKTLFDNGALAPQETKPVSDILLSVIFFGNGGLLNAARTQLEQQYRALYSSFGANATLANAWLDAVLVLEMAADLHNKEEMYIYDFSADEKLLAGGRLKAFQGFFDERYREHDYDYGRQVARALLAKYVTREGVFNQLHWKPAALPPINKIDPTLNDLEMTAVDKRLRQKVRDQLLDATGKLLEELDIKPLFRWALKACFIRKFVAKSLEL